MDDAAIPPDWQASLDELARRRKLAQAMGSPDKLTRRQQQERLNAREVIDAFVDAGSFTELGALVGHLDQLPADGLVGGFATVEGRPVVLAVEDATVKGGSIGHGTAAKRERLALLAGQEDVPYVLFLDGAGYRVSNTLERHPYTPNDLQALTALQDKVPTAAVVLGASAGHGALSAAMTDYLVMLERGSLFTAGPPLVAAALGEQASPAELGGALIHATHSGVGHALARDEQQAFELLRRWLSFAGKDHSQPGQPIPGTDSGPRRLDNLLELIPHDNQLPYDMRSVVTELVDRNQPSLPYQPDYGTSILTQFGYLGGYRVGVVANQPMIMAGAITSEAAQKASRFLRLCDKYRLPVVFLADNPGVMPGSQAERQGIIHHAATMFAAQARLKSPKLHVTLRKAFGFGSSLMGMNPFDGQTLCLAFPGVNLGGIPSLGGAKAMSANTAMRDELLSAEADAAWNSSDSLAYDDVIDPRELRNALLSGLRLASGRMKQGKPGTLITQNQEST